MEVAGVDLHPTQGIFSGVRHLWRPATGTRLSPGDPANHRWLEFTAKWADAGRGGGGMPLPIPPSLYGCAASQRWKREPGPERLPGRLAGQEGHQLRSGCSSRIISGRRCHISGGLWDLGCGLFVFEAL